MVHPGTLLKASLDASKAFFRSSAQGSARHPATPAASSSLIVPIRSLGPSHAGRIAAHLLALEPQDRYLRFGYLANDEQVRRYVDGLDFERDEIFGIYSRKLELIAVAHLAFSADPQLNSCAEFGVSVLAHARGRGYGARLFDRAVMHARNEGVEMMFIHALSENTAMLAIAHRAGATLERDGVETEAYLKLRPADLDSRFTELLEEQIAQTDYRLKVQARQFRDFLAVLQKIRQGVRDSRDRMRK
jgi:RimJ/RimL family protein N-acetyltransferase